MSKQLSEAEKKLIARLNRVKGQLAAISRMIEEGEDPKKISIQIAAAFSGMEGVRESYLKARLLDEAYKSMQAVLETVNE